jgi:hypothetical protein
MMVSKTRRVLWRVRRNEHDVDEEDGGQRAGVEYDREQDEYNGEYHARSSMAASMPTATRRRTTRSMESRMPNRLVTSRMATLRMVAT